MPQSKKATDICLSGKGYKASSKPQWESISKKQENLEQWWTFAIVADQPKLLRECSDDSSRKSKKNPEQHLKSCKSEITHIISLILR